MPLSALRPDELVEQLPVELERLPQVVAAGAVVVDRRLRIPTVAKRLFEQRVGARNSCFGIVDELRLYLVPARQVAVPLALVELTEGHDETVPPATGGKQTLRVQ